MRNLIQDSSIPSNSLSQPLVTILLPTHNRSHLLLQALNSVFAQTYTSLQIIVADDASTDATPAILRPIIDPRLEKLSRPVNLGQMGNLNACLSCTRGEFVLVLSDDDMLLPECVAKLAESLQVYPSATMAYGQTRKETIDGQLLVNTRPSPSSIESGHEFVMKWIAGERDVAFCCAMFRTRHLREIGGFPPFPTGDAAARAAVALRGDVLHVSEMLAVYRVHSNSVTYSYSTIQWAKEESSLWWTTLPTIYPARSESISSVWAENTLPAHAVADWVTPLMRGFRPTRHGRSSNTASKPLGGVHCCGGHGLVYLPSRYCPLALSSPCENSGIAFTQRGIRLSAPDVVLPVFCNK